MTGVKVRDVHLQRICHGVTGTNFIPNYTFCYIKRPEVQTIFLFTEFFLMSAKEKV